MEECCFVYLSYISTTFTPLNLKMSWNSYNLFSFACNDSAILLSLTAQWPQASPLSAEFVERGRDCLSNDGLVLLRAKEFDSASADVRSNNRLFCFYGSIFIDIRFELVVPLGFRADL